MISHFIFGTIIDGSFSWFNLQLLLFSFSSACIKAVFSESSCEYRMLILTEQFCMYYIDTYLKGLFSQNKGSGGAFSCKKVTESNYSLSLIKWKMIKKWQSIDYTTNWLQAAWLFWHPIFAWGPLQAILESVLWIRSK